MKLSMKHIFIVFGMTIFLMLVLNHFMTENIVTYKEKRSPSPENRPAISKNTKNQINSQSQKLRHKLVPQDPAKYGMIAYSPGDTPRTLQQWEGHLQSTFDKKKIFESENAKKILKQHEITSVEFEQRMAELDKNIAIYQEKLKEDPLNENLEKQLEQLYKLKAVSTLLKEKIVKPAL